MKNGQLLVNVTDFSTNKPIDNAEIYVLDMNDANNVLRKSSTDINGKSQILDLLAPDFIHSESPDGVKPYSEYTVVVKKEGYESIEISGVEIMPQVTAILNEKMIPAAQDKDSVLVYVIGEHTLWGAYPPKISEPEIMPVNDSGEIVLSRVVIPEYIVVHDGPPSDRNAKDYYVLYKDYIKNVASSEIYATWSKEAIKANVLAIQSFTLNRVYTEFYRNKGYNFTITSSTAYDHKWINGRNIFDTISEVVDSIFNLYLSRPGIKQPILSQYCDGKKLSCPGLLSQWGSEELGRQGYDAEAIIKYYYGDSMYINSTETISGVPASWPGMNLGMGMAGDKVRQLQTEINGVAKGYPLIKTIAVDGIYGSETTQAVKTFQEIFGLPATGVVDFSTWYKISEIYVGVSKIAEYV